MEEPFLPGILQPGGGLSHPYPPVLPPSQSQLSRYPYFLVSFFLPCPLKFHALSSGRHLLPCWTSPSIFSETKFISLIWCFPVILSMSALPQGLGFSRGLTSQERTPGIGRGEEEGKYTRQYFNAFCSMIELLLCWIGPCHCKVGQFTHDKVTRTIKWILSEKMRYQVCSISEHLVYLQVFISLPYLNAKPFPLL